MSCTLCFFFARDSKFRYSRKDYTNDMSKIKNIKEKYKNGVTQDTINDMLGIKN